MTTPMIGMPVQYKPMGKPGYSLPVVPALVFGNISGTTADIIVPGQPYNVLHSGVANDDSHSMDNTWGPVA